MKIRWTKPALRHVDEIFAYISADNPQVAFSVVQHIDNTVSYLAQFPEMGKPTDKTGVRMLVIGRYPYLVFYRLKKHEIEILYVMHGAREQEE
jgi:addiction module RelE/StbE family toxin